MQWNELTILPQDNKVVLIYVKNDTEEDQYVIATAKFNISKGWAVGLKENFSVLRPEFSVVKWMEIPLPE